jgi:RHS repeat-associated protein
LRKPPKTLLCLPHNPNSTNDDAQFTGIDKPDPADPTKEPYNVYRFNAKRFDPNTGTYDMGFRDYNPGLNRFLTRDTYNGALADLNLALNPWTGNRYAYAGGNPLSMVELDGHKFEEETGAEYNARLAKYYAARAKPASPPSVENSTLKSILGEIMQGRTQLGSRATARLAPR